MTACIAGPAPALQLPSLQPHVGIAAQVEGLGVESLHPFGGDMAGVPPSPMAATALPAIEHDLIAGACQLQPHHICVQFAIFSCTCGAALEAYLNLFALCMPLEQHTCGFAPSTEAAKSQPG